MSSLDFSATPSVASTKSGCSVVASSGDTPGGLVEFHRAQRLHQPRHLGGEGRGRLRHPRADDRQFLVERGILHPLIQAAPLERVVHVARAVRRQDDERRRGGANRAELRDRDLVLGQQFEQIALELLVGTVDLVDEQHRRSRPRPIDRLQQRPLDQEGLAVQLAPRGGAIQRSRGLEHAQLHELPCVVPLVDRVRDVEALVALQPDEVGVERRGQRARECRLADAGFALEEERTAETERQEARYRQAVVGDVVLRQEALLQVQD
jgi:hypothetical protein